MEGGSLRNNSEYSETVGTWFSKNLQKGGIGIASLSGLCLCTIHTPAANNLKLKTPPAVTEHQTEAFMKRNSEPHDMTRSRLKFR